MIRRSNAIEKSILIRASNALLDWNPGDHCCCQRERASSVKGELKAKLHYMNKLETSFEILT